MPNGKQLKQCLPMGIINVVSNADRGKSFICQKPELASSLENILASLSLAKVCSTERRICRLWHTLLFGFVKSTQLRTLLLLFGTTTIPAHQSVGTLTLWMTPNASMHFNSFLYLAFQR